MFLVLYAWRLKPSVSRCRYGDTLEYAWYSVAKRNEVTQVVYDSEQCTVEYRPELACPACRVKNIWVIKWKSRVDDNPRAYCRECLQRFDYQESGLVRGENVAKDLDALRSLPLESK